MATITDARLLAIAMGLVGAIAITAIGCYLLRRVVEDDSNSASLGSFAVRLFRIAPGALVLGYGCYEIGRLITAILEFAH